jgi:diacylglycerol kinase (ATP)
VLGVVAAGSGSDVVRSLGLPGDAIRASHHLAGDEVRDLDLGKITFKSRSSSASRYFINIAEAGLGAAVVARTGRLPRFLGPAKYFCGFWLTLPGLRSSALSLTADGQSFRWRAHNVVVANCRFYGGGMHISPNSRPDDGVLDALVMVGPKTDAFTLLPRIYSGSHLPHRNIRELQARHVLLEADPPVLVEADGEVLGTTPVTFEVVPRAIRVKV